MPEEVSAGGPSEDRGLAKAPPRAAAALSLREAARPAGDLFTRIVTPLFAHVALDPEITARLERAHAEGLVVHVLRSRRVIDPLFVRSVLERLGLPVPRWMHDHYASELAPSVEAMLGALRAGEPVLLFLRRPRTLIGGSGEYSEKHVEALLQLQRQIDRPIFLVPETLLLGRVATGIRRTIFDVIFGDREAPGRLRELVGFLLNRGEARFHAGAPINLRAFMEREAGTVHRSIAKKIRWSILNHLAREDALRSAPPPRSVERTRQHVLKDPSVQRALRDREEETGQSQEAVRITAEQILRRMAAEPRLGWIRVLDAILDRIWRDIYDGIAVDEAGLRKVWATARRGPIVLVPSHKSHIDYLVLSQVFFKDGLIPPHIAAGDNLAIPLLGTAFRRSGAFFIRRGFKGDKLYATILAAYVRRLLKDGHAVEFFIEGGRSRTGKQLEPKMGMLSMCVDPVLDGALNDVSFVPVSISYEKIVEARAYAHELGGGEKKKEDLGALVSARKVLRSRYGRVYVDFDEPISLRAFAAARGVEVKPRSELDGAPADDAARKSLVRQLGHRIGYGIDSVTRVTPTSVAATVLLAQTRPGMAESELTRRAERLLGFLSEIGARLSATLDAETRVAALREALGRLAGDGVVRMTPSPDGDETIYQIDDAGRRALDFYKNNTLHFVAPYAVVCLAVLAQPSSPAPEAVLREDASALAELLDRELNFRTGDRFDDGFSALVDRLVARRVLLRLQDEDGGLRYGPTHIGRDAALELAGLLAVFFEAYRLVLEGLDALEDGPLAEAELSRRLLQRGARQALEGKIRRAEAVSKPTLQNALRWARDRGLVQLTESGALALGPEAESRRDRVARLDRTLRALLD